ncbi:MAG: restriction endonuclease subunit S [Planctomycetia bacterium]|nr:restriction endonuclease subunit S [Planctomycetia bacterium]
MHYESVGGQTRCIEDEIPFEIPENWNWVRLNNITQYIQRGRSPKYSDIRQYPVLAQKCNQWNGITLEKALFIDPATVSKYGEERFLQDNDIVVNSTGTGTLGRIGIFSRDCLGLYAAIVADSHITVIRGLNISMRYLYCLLCSFLYQKWLEDHADGSTNQKELYIGTIQSILIPLPPLAEQKRIVEKIESVLAQVDTIDAESKKLEVLATQSKSKILDLAIRGKLVPQDPNDEPASVLLERIQKEKQKLVKAGKIKAEKQTSFIFRDSDNRHYETIGNQIRCIQDEIPFEIPENWCWCRLGNVIHIGPRNNLPDDLIVSFVPMTLIGDGYQNNHSAEKRKWKDIKTGFTHFAEGDIGIAKITPCFENRKSTIFRGLLNGYGAGTTELHILRMYHGTINSLYVLAFCKSPTFITGGVDTYTGTAGQQRVGRDYVANTLFPLPPLGEQHRIVTEVENLLEICGRL